MTEQIVEPSEAEVQAAMNGFAHASWIAGMTHKEAFRHALIAAAKVRAQQEQGR